MVDSIGPNKIKPITKSKPVVSGKMEKPKHGWDQQENDSQDLDGEERRVGVTIDEQC